MDAVLLQCNVEAAKQSYKQQYILNQRSSQVNTVTNSITKAITNTYSTSNIKDINYRGFQSFLYSISSTWSLN